MKNRLLVFIFLCVLAMAQCAPGPRGNPACLIQECDLDSGPVCGIDASGLPRTFENRCMAMFAYCRDGSYFAEVRPGEC